MNIFVPRLNIRPQLNRLWAKVVGSYIAPYVTHEAQMLTAAMLVKQHGPDSAIAAMFAQAWFGRELRGAGRAWESQYPLAINEAETSPVDTTGANGLDLNCYDWAEVMEIGVGWTTAGTVTALVMDFDYYPRLNAGGTVTDKLDGTNGVLTAPSVAGQAIGNVNFKRFDGGTVAAVGPISINKGTSINALVTTTTTAGAAVPYVLVIPRAVENTSVSTVLESA